MTNLTDELIAIAREVEALKRECGMDPESPTAIQNGRYMDISYKLRALAAGGASQERAASPSDLVAKLRDTSGSHINGLYDLEAANEIERLRAAVLLAEAPVERLIAAIEGECDGLAITEAQAKAILRYVNAGAQERAASPALREALRKLTFAARTTGGTAGPDSDLMAACDEAERALATLPQNAEERAEYLRNNWPFPK